VLISRDEGVTGSVSKNMYGPVSNLVVDLWLVVVVLDLSLGSALVRLQF
jgi:hypothetical protein